MRSSGLTVVAILWGMALVAVPAEAKKCKADAIKVGDVGDVCVDKYEASVWEIAPTNTSLIKDVQKSKIASAADLSGATQHGVTGDDYGTGCPLTGNGCKDFYAVSVVGVTPSTYVTWFQAAAACRNAGKHLATNQEWQMAALGTPDPGTDDGTSDCNVASTTFMLPEDPVSTGSRSSCVSDVGAFDMVGNVCEWVADWGDLAISGTNWSATYGNDQSFVGGDGSVNLPGALHRGGCFGNGANAGVFTVNSVNTSTSTAGQGFRCAREP